MDPSAADQRSALSVAGCIALPAMRGFLSVLACCQLAAGMLLMREIAAALGRKGSSGLRAGPAAPQHCYKALHGDTLG